MLKSYESIPEKSASDLLSHLLPTLSLVGEEGEFQMGITMKDLVTELSRSHETSCSSLGNILSSKVATLNALIS